MKLKTTYLLILSLVIAGFSALGQTPVANFNSNTVSGCSPLIVDFRDQSTGGVTEWSWNFGNGGISNKQNPSAIYFNPGTYTVTLTVKTASGASNTVTKTAFITVVNEPVVNFKTDKTSGCSPAVIKFTDQSTTPPVPLLQDGNGILVMEEHQTNKIQLMFIATQVVIQFH